MTKLIELITIYPISFFLMMGLLVAGFLTIKEEIKRKKK